MFMPILKMLNQKSMACYPIRCIGQNNGLRTGLTFLRQRAITIYQNGALWLCHTQAIFECVTERVRKAT